MGESAMNRLLDICMLGGKVTFSFDAVLNAYIIRADRVYKGENVRWQAAVPKDLYLDLKSDKAADIFWIMQFEKILDQLSSEECEKLIKERDNGDH